MEFTRTEARELLKALRFGHAVDRAVKEDIALNPRAAALLLGAEKEDRSIVGRAATALLNGRKVTHYLVQLKHNQMLYKLVTALAQAMVS